MKMRGWAPLAIDCSDLLWSDIFGLRMNKESLSGAHLQSHSCQDSCCMLGEGKIVKVKQHSSSFSQIWFAAGSYLLIIDDIRTALHMDYQRVKDNYSRKRSWPHSRSPLSSFIWSCQSILPCGYMPWHAAFSGQYCYPKGTSQEMDVDKWESWEIWNCWG